MAEDTDQMEDRHSQRPEKKNGPGREKKTHLTPTAVRYRALKRHHPSVGSKHGETCWCRVPGCSKAAPTAWEQSYIAPFMVSAGHIRLRKVLMGPFSFLLFLLSAGLCCIHLSPHSAAQYHCTFSSSIHLTLALQCSKHVG